MGDPLPGVQMDPCLAPGKGQLEAIESALQEINAQRGTAAIAGGNQDRLTAASGAPAEVPSAESTGVSGGRRDPTHSPTLQLVYLQDPRLLAWAGRALGSEFDPWLCKWIGGVRDGAVVFVLVYEQFRARDCWLHIATDGARRWASKRVLRAILAQPFVHWGMRRVTFLVRETNEASLELCRRLGARQEGRARAAFEGDVDGIVFGMLREEAAPWLGRARIKGGSAVHG